MRNILKLSVRGIPLLPLCIMAVSLSAASLVSTQNVSSSVTILTNFQIALFSFTGANGAACGSGTTGTAFTTASYGSVSGSTASTTNSTQWCFRNPGNSPVFTGQLAPESFFATTSGTLPTGATESVKAWTGTLSSTSNYCIPIGAFQLYDPTCTTVQVAGSLVLQLSIAANTPAGTFSWVDTFHGYSTASG